MKNNSLSREGLERLVRRAVCQGFAAGENWAITYSSWFTPDKKDTWAKRALVQDRMLAELHRLTGEMR